MLFINIIHFIPTEALGIHKPIIFTFNIHIKMIWILYIYMNVAFSISLFEEYRMTTNNVEHILNWRKKTFAAYTIRRSSHLNCWKLVLYVNQANFIPTDWCSPFELSWVVLSNFFSNNSMCEWRPVCHSLTFLN